MVDFDYSGLDLVEVPEGAAADLQEMREAGYGAPYPEPVDWSGLELVEPDAPAVDWDAEKTWARQFNPVYRPDGSPFPTERAALEARSGLGIEDARILPLQEGGYRLVRAPATDEDRDRLDRLNARIGRDAGEKDETTTLGEIGEIPAGVAAGAVGTAGTALQGVSAAFPPARDDIPEERKEALRGKMREAEDALMKGDVEAYSRLTREIHREALVPVTQRGGFQAGQRIRDWGQRTFPATEGYEDSFGRQVGEGVGSLITGIAASVVHPGAATVLFTTLGMGEAADRAAQTLSEKHGSEAVDRGDYDEQITRAAILGVGPGMTDQIPVEVLLKRLPVPGARAVGQAIRAFGGERVMRAIGRIGTQAVLEAVQEGGQQALQNLIARHVHTPETEITEGVLPGAGVGGVVGGIAGVGREAVLNLAGRRSRSARGVRAQAAENVPPPTAEDEASPIPTETIVEGRKVVADAEGKKVADRILNAEGMPPVGTPVRIAIGRKGYEGVVTDAWGEGPDAGITVTEADGTAIDATLQELHAFGAELEILSDAYVEGEPEAVPPEIAAQDRHISEIAAEGRTADVETTAGTEADTGGWTPPANLPSLSPRQAEAVADLVKGGMDADRAVAVAAAMPAGDVETEAGTEAETGGWTPPEGVSRVPEAASIAPEGASRPTDAAPAPPAPEALPEGDVDDMAPVESDLEIVEMAPEGGATPEGAAPDAALPERGISPEAMVDATVETEAPVETETGPRILMRKSGEPFKSSGTARLAADRREMLDPDEYRIVEVEGGYGIEVLPGVEIETAAPETGEQEAPPAERPEPTPEAMQGADVETTAPVETAETDGMTAGERLARRRAEQRVATMAPDEARQYLDNLRTAGWRVEGIEIPGEPARAEPSPEATVDRTVETEAPVETEDRGPQPELVYRKDGQPFKTARAAEFAARAKKLEGYIPVEVEGGFAIEVTAAQGEQDTQGPVAAGRTEGTDVPPGEPGVRPVDQGRAPVEPVAPDQEPGARTEIPAGAPVGGAPGVEPEGGVAPPPSQVPGSPPSRPVREVDRPARVITPAGRRVEVQPIVVEARDLIASHDETGRENPTFPSEFQPRDRSRAASQEQIASMAGDLIPELLMPSAQSAEGAPVVGPDRVVESGNARTLAIRRAYDMGMADDYRRHLVERGYDIEGFDQPVLAQQRLTSMTPEERAEFAREANARTTADRGASEVATSDAASVTRDMLDLYQPGDIGSAGNREFVRAFVGGVVPDMERAGMMAADGTLSQAGKQRIENALFDKAYGDAELLGALREDLDSNVKSLGGAMLDAAPEWARMRLAVAEGSADPVVDHTEHIIAAVRMVRKARNERAKLSELVAQDEMFSGDAMHPLAEQWLRMMHADREEITGQVGRPKLAAALDFWAAEGQKKLPGGNMFGEVVDSAEISRMMKTAREKMQVKRDEQTDAEAQADLLRGAPAQGPGPDGQGDGPGAAGPETAAQAGQGRERGDREGERGDRSGLAEPGLADDFEPRQLTLFAERGSGDLPGRPAGEAVSREPRRATHRIGKADVLALEDVRVGLTHVRNAEDAAHVAAPFRKEPQETAVGIVLDRDSKLLGVVRHTVGTLNNTPLDIAHLVGTMAQVPGASSFYLAHQHPSGNVEQSRSDRQMSRMLSDATRKTDLTYQGSLVVAPNARQASLDLPGAEPTERTMTVNVRALPRRQTAPVYRRRWLKVPAQDAPLVNSFDRARQAAREFLPELSGVMLIDTRLRLVGVMAMDTAEMSRLRGPGGAATDLVREMAETNADRLFVIARSESDQPARGSAEYGAIENMRRFARAVSVGDKTKEVASILFNRSGETALQIDEELTPGRSFFQRGDRGTAAKPPLDPDREVAVTEATSRYADLKPSTARTRARLDANRDIQGRSFVNEDTGWPIEVTRQGIRESLTGDQSAVRAEIVANLPDLIRTAVRVEGHQDRHGRDRVAMVHRFYAPFLLDGRLDRVKLTIREFTDGAKRHYAVEFMEIAGSDVYMAPRGAPAWQSPEQSIAPSGTAEPVVSLRPFLSGVKYDDGSDPRWADRDAEMGVGVGPLARALPEGSATSLEGDPDADASVAPPDDEIKLQRGQPEDAAPDARVRIRPTRRFDAERLAIRAEIEALGERAFGKGFDIRLADRILTPEGDPATGAFDPAARIAYIALRDPADMTGTLHHEGLHYLRRAGAFTRQDGKPTASWKVLEAEAPRWREKYRIDERYPEGIGEDLKNEEAIAEAIDDYAKNRPPEIAGKVKLAMDRILAFWKRLGNAIRGRGFQTWTDVFEGVSAGEFVGPDGRPDAEAMDRYLQIAWHASPHEFARFSTRHIGSGEGAQVYGWGLYFADKRGVAEWYKQGFENQQNERLRLKGKPVDLGLEYYLGRIADRPDGETFEEAKRIALQVVDMDLEAFRESWTKYLNNEPFARKPHIGIDELESRRTIVAAVRDGDLERSKRVPLYRVDLAPKEKEYLYWDRTLGMQSETVQKALRGLDDDVIRAWRTNGAWPHTSGASLYRHLAQARGSDRAASEALLAAGIRGIKYLDQSSRPMRGALGRTRIPLRETHNYVIFDDSDVAIEEIMLQRRRLGEFNTEPGAEGVDQAIIPGTEALTEREVLERRMQERDRGKVEQRPLDFGLFADPDEEQMPLFQRPPTSRFGAGSAVASQIVEDLIPVVDVSSGPTDFLYESRDRVSAARAFPETVGDELRSLADLLQNREFRERGWFRDATRGIAEGDSTARVHYGRPVVERRDPWIGETLELGPARKDGMQEAEIPLEDIFLNSYQTLVYSPKPLRDAIGNLSDFYEKHRGGRMERAGAKPLDDEALRKFTADSYATVGERKGGLPVVVYSGTSAGYFEEFDPPDPRDKRRAAVWGSTDIDVASTYAQGETRFLTPADRPGLDEEAKKQYRDALLGSDTFDAEFPNTWAVVAYAEGIPKDRPPPFTGEQWLEALDEYDGNSGLAVSHIRALHGGEAGTDALVEALRDEYEKMVLEASAYSQNTAGVYPLVLSLTNPLVVNGQGNRWDELALYPDLFTAPARNGDTVNPVPLLERLTHWQPSDMTSTSDLAYAAREAGFDGVIFKNIVDTADAHHAVADIYLAYEPNQVKDLRAEKFDPKSSNIFYQRVSAENREAFEEAATQQFGIDMKGAAADVKKRKASMREIGRELGDQLLGPTRKGRSEGIAVADLEDPKDLNMLLRWLAPPGVWAKKYPRIHKVWRQGVKAEVDQSVYIKRLNREWDEITKPLSKEEFEQLTGLMFLGDAEARAFTDAEIDDFKVGDKVKTAYRGARRFVDKLGRWTEQHERNMKLDLLKRRSKLIRELAGRRGMSIEAFRELYRERAILKGHMRHGRGNPDKLAAEIKDADYRLHGEMLEDPEYRELAGEADSLEARLENTTVRRRSGYVPHKFFGNWQVLWANERAAGWNTATGARGDAADGEVREGDASGAPVWEQVAGEDGYFPSRMAALKAAREFQKGKPDAKIMVKPVEFAFPDSKATVLTDAAYTALRERVRKLMEVDGEELDAVLEGVARPRNRRRFAGFEEYREGMPGFNKNLDRVIRAHIGETVRYTALDKLKYDAITAMEKEGLQRSRVTQERPELQKAVESFLRDVNGQKQPVEQQVDAILNRDWATPLRVGLAAGGAAFLAAGGATTSLVAGGLIGSYVGYRVTRSLARGGEFPSRAVTAGMLSDMSHLKLGMVTNIMSAVVNLTQTGLNTYPVLGVRDTSAGIRRLSAAIASNARGKPNNDWKILVKNDVNPTFGFGEGTKNQFQKEPALSKLSMLAFTSAEGFNRSVAFLGAVNKAERQGKSWGQAVQEGKRTMERTQFHYGPANKPELLRGNFLRVPLQFKNFVAQQLTFALGVRGKEIPRFLLSLFLVAGALGIPGLDALDWLMEIMFDWSPIAAIKEGALQLAAEGELEGGLGQLMARGVPGALGVEISGRTGMGEKFLPLQIRDFAGPWFSTVENAARHAQERAGAVEQIRNLSPGIGNPLRALEAAGAGGQVSNPWKRGRPEMTYTPGELVTKAVGGRPTREAMEQDWRDIYRRRTERMRLWNRRYVDRAVSALQAGRRRDFLAIMREAREAGTPITPSQLRSALRGMATERAERTLRTLPKSLRGEARELRRGLDRAAP